jgi:UDP-N-acetylmuramyl pentapeptide phosphotransferase/UDP-N-acetylglucosamine-1-phosphate transferase
MSGSVDTLLAFAIVAGSAAVTVLLIRVLHPLLIRYALARPNARSSHTIPTPQGGGIAVVGVVVGVVFWHGVADVPGFRDGWAWALMVGLLVLAVTGAVDDIRPLPVLPRLLLHFAVATLLVLTLPKIVSLVPIVPMPVQALGLVLGLVWFINLTNFMDGIDWMTVVEMLPLAVCLALLGGSGAVPEMTAVLPVVLALIGGMIGFAPFNAHVARLFLGDVGSLPIGALLGWLVIVLAMAGHRVAALILPLYYLADATLTLGRRFRNGERLSQAHRSHFYQRAVSGGYSVPEVTRVVLLLNIVLCVLAWISVHSDRSAIQLLCVGAAIAATAFVLRRFELGRTR